MSDPKEYTIGWICALSTEHTAACLFLDEEHDQPDPDLIAVGDNNAYTLGLMAGHKVVIAVLPHGEYGTTTTAIVATNMLRSFPNIKVGLMVGIGGGAPTKEHDIRLGDVVVSSPQDGKGGVYQYDYGKRIQNHDFKPTGHLNQPPSAVLTAMALLVSKFERKGNQVRETIDAILENNTRLKKKYGRPKSDHLYASDFVHPQDDEGQGCRNFCETQPSNLIHRPPREDYEDDPAVHCGLIASGNSLMKDALIRDSLASKGILCFEMEAAGLMNNFPCLVVRGICDYSDSHKNKEWQGYAAMTAAAYTKDLLKVMVPKRVEGEPKLATVLESLHDKTTYIQDTLKQSQQEQQTQHIKIWLSPSDPSINLDKALERRHPDTCRWLLDSNEYRSWRTTPSSFFWLHGLSGCGKTVLASSIIQHLQSEISKACIAYYYFNVNGGDSQDMSQMLRSLLFQLCLKHFAARETLQVLYVQCDKGARQPTTRQLLEQFTSMLGLMDEIFVVIDGLDECNYPDDVVSWLSNLTRVNRDSLRLLVTSRKQGVLSTAIDDWPRRDQLHAVQTDEIGKDIASYIHARIFGSREFAKWNAHEGLQGLVKNAVLQRANGMFRLAACQLDDLKSCIDRTRLMAALDALPTTLQEIYTRILVTLKESHCYREALFMLQYVLWSGTPPTFPTMIDAIAVRLDESPGFVQENRLFDLMDVIAQCSSLLTIVDVRDHYNEWQEIHLAHSSVKEYLTSQLLVRPFDELLSEVQARAIIAKTCIRYVIDVASLQLEAMDHQGYPENTDGSTPRSYNSTDNLNDTMELSFALTELPNRKRFPFVQSAIFWMEHARVSEDADFDLVQLVLQLYRLWHLLCSFPPTLEYGTYTPNPDLYGSINICADPHPLIHACCWGLEFIVRCLLLETGADISSCGCDLCRDSPLHAASYNGHQNLVRMLLDWGAHVDGHPECPPRSKPIPIIGASRNGHTEVVKTLLHYGARMDAQDHFGHTAIEVAASRGNTEVVRLLLEHECCTHWPLRSDAYERAMVLAAPNSEVVCLLVEKVNVQGSSDMTSALYETLRTAVRYGYNEDVRSLLQTGAYRHTCLNPVAALAIKGRRATKLEMILDHGADLNGCSKSLNVLHRSSCKEMDLLLIALDVRFMSKQIVDLLCDRGASIKSASRSEFTRVLLGLFDSNELAFARLLLDRGADVPLDLFQFAWRGPVGQEPFDLVRTLLDRGVVPLSGPNNIGDGDSNAVFKPWDIRVLLSWDANCNWRAVVEIANPEGHRDDDLKKAYLIKAGARSTQDALRDAYKDIAGLGKAGSHLDIFEGWPNGGQELRF